MELLVCAFITFLIMRAHHAVKSEWQHSRDTHATQLSRDHPDWSPGRIRRNARRRARGDWLTEIGDGFPTLRQTLAEDRVLAQAVRHEKLAAGEERIGKLRERVAAAIEKREALRREGKEEPAPHVTPEPAGAVAEPEVVPDAKPGRHARPEPAAEPEPGTGDGYDPELDSVVHHDHTYMLPGQCPQCHGPGLGIPFVRGDHVKEVRAPDGTLLGKDGTVVSADDEKVTVKLPNGLRVTGRNAAVPVAHRNGDSPGDPPIDDAVIGADREFADEDPQTDSPAMPTAFMTEAERAHYNATGKFVPGTGHDDDPEASARAERALGGADWPEDNWPDEEAIPNPPSDDTTDDTTDQGEGDEMTTTEIDSADTPFHGMQNAFQNYADEATRVAKDAADDLQAQAAIHGFDRDQQTMADIQALTDHAQALAAQATAAKQGLIDRHNAAEEYHGTGQDAHASAFRPA